jgi:hypothetical protein
VLRSGPSATPGTGERRKRISDFALTAPRATAHACFSTRLISNYELCLLSSFFLFPPVSRCCPYGPLLSVASALAIVATLLTWFGSFDCNFYKANGLGIGLWAVEDDLALNAFTFSGESSDDTCQGWNEAPQFVQDLLDTPMKFARALSLIACLSSAVVFVIILLPSCMTFPRMFIKSLAIFMFFLSFIVMLCLVSRTCCIRVFTIFFDEPWSHHSAMYSRFVSGGPGFGYLH